MSFNPPIDHLCNGNLGWHPRALPSEMVEWRPKWFKQAAVLRQIHGCHRCFSMAQCFSASMLQCFRLRVAVQEGALDDAHLFERSWMRRRELTGGLRSTKRKHRRWQKHDRWIKPGRPLSFCSRTLFARDPLMFSKLWLLLRRIQKQESMCRCARLTESASKEELGHILFLVFRRGRWNDPINDFHRRHAHRSYNTFRPASLWCLASWWERNGNTMSELI